MLKFMRASEVLLQQVAAKVLKKEEKSVGRSACCESHKRIFLLDVFRMLTLKL
jgi:hypothetical protein